MARVSDRVKMYVVVCPDHGFDSIDRTGVSGDRVYTCHGSDTCDFRLCVQGNARQPTPAVRAAMDAVVAVPGVMQWHGTISIDLPEDEA